MMDKLVYEAVLENIRNRKDMRLNGEDKAISKNQWMKDFCTIHLNIGRNTGKTRHIVENAKTGDLIVCRQGTRKLIESQVNIGLDFYVPHVVKDVYGKMFEECKIVFVDEPYQTLKPFRDIFEFYNHFDRNTKEPIFIMLGE